MILRSKTVALKEKKTRLMLIILTTTLFLLVKHRPSCNHQALLL